MIVKEGLSDEGERNLTSQALALTILMALGAIVAATVVGSLALISYAAHMFISAIALLISITALRTGSRSSHRRFVFRYYHFELIATVLNAALLSFVVVHMLYQASSQLHEVPQVMSDTMILVAALGFFVDMLNLRLLADAKEPEPEFADFYPAIWQGLLCSTAIIVSAITIRLTEWIWADPLTAAVLVIWVVRRAYLLWEAALTDVMKNVPDDINPVDVTNSLLEIPFVAGVHELHIWSPANGTIIVTAHVESEINGPGQQALLKKIHTVLTEQFDIQGVTIQIEERPMPRWASERVKPRLSG